MDLSLREQVESARLGAPSTGPRSRDGVRSCEGSRRNTTHGFSQDDGLSFDGLSGSLAAAALPAAAASSLALEPLFERLKETKSSTTASGGSLG